MLRQPHFCTAKLTAPVLTSTASIDLRDMSASIRNTTTKTKIARDQDFDFWQDKVGRPFAILLHKAGYNLETQYAYIRFFLDWIIPALGPSYELSSNHIRWKSFMTDDHTPAELSWEWRHTGEDPDIRYSIEPIGLSAGGNADPFNLQATRDLIGQLHHTVPGIDLRWYNHFAERLLPHARDAESHQGTVVGTPPTDSHSSSFIAFDLRRTDPVAVKAYFLPSVRATQSGTKNFDLIVRAIQTLPESRNGGFQALQLLIEYTEADPFGTQLECEILGIDCVSTKSARVKIYFRSRSTSFDSIRSVMTLGNRVNAPENNSAFHDLFELWQALFFSGMDVPTTASTELRSCSHRTAGILYYLDLSENNPKPVPKVYLPVRHYGESDYQIAKAVCAYMKRKGQQHEARQYLAALREIL